MKIFRTVFILELSFFLTVICGCSLDISNPNSPTTSDVLQSREGIKDFEIGMQGFFSDDVYSDIVLNTGVTSREVAVDNTFASLIELEMGGKALPPENSGVTNLWSGLMRTISMNDQILDNAPHVINKKADLSGIIALSSVYKAMALGYTIQCFKESPTKSGNSVKFFSRQKVISKALTLLNNALQKINTTSPSEEFNSNILLKGFDLRNTIYALQARYNLFSGKYQAAIDAANKVDMSATSIFSYDGSTHRNPIYEDVVEGQAQHAPRDEFGSPLYETGDKRIDFFEKETDEKSTPNNFSINQLTGFYTTASSSIPVYRPGEMPLIKAEAYVELGQLSKAVNSINKIRTKTASEDPFGIGAGLPPYSGAVNKSSLLEEIFYQRSAELYLTGMRFEDMRRLNRPVPTDDPPLTAPRNRVYYPYPKQERQNNPNTPDNPEI